jgi:endo-1,4-beta-xylanase
MKQLQNREEAWTRRSFLTSGLALGAGMSAAALARVPMLGVARELRGIYGVAGEANEITGRGSLRAHAAAHGLLTGAAVNVALLKTETDYPRVLMQQYSILVAENAMKSKALRPAPDRFSFDQGDALVAFAEQHNIKVRGHNLVWHEALPDWFQATVNKQNAHQVLTGHIMTVAGHYRGKLHSWDVVNEAVSPKDGRPDGLRNSPWLELLGPDYLDVAFRTARQADPNVLLTYNDYGIEDESGENAKKREAILRLLRRLKAANVPLDAVGIQSHIKAGSPYAFGKGLRDFMAAARETGLKILITELDVNDDDLPYDDVTKRDHAVAAVYTDYLDLVLSEPAVIAILTWGVTDRHTWLNNEAAHKKKQPNRPQRALPFDDNYQPTEAFFAMRAAFDRRTVSSSTASQRVSESASQQVSAKTPTRLCWSQSS